jgi:hypothetical protein
MFLTKPFIELDAYVVSIFVILYFKLEFFLPYFVSLQGTLI